MADSRDRHNTGGYDFGGYRPGADFTPRKQPKWKAVVAIVLLVGLVGVYVFALL